jgi:hypothetical protein
VRKKTCRLASSFLAGVGAVALTVGYLMYSTKAQADEFLSGNCSKCLTAADSGNPCGTANTCPVTVCTSCTCSAPAASGGTCK